MTTALLATALLMQSPEPYRVCIDPGHPSEVGRGTTGKRISELRAAWLVAKGMERQLKARGIRIVLTKSKEDQFVKNIDRARIANQFRSDLMVRLHCDAATGRGFGTFYPARQGRHSSGKVGPSPQLLRVIKPVAEVFHRSLAKGLRGELPDRGLKTDAQTYVGGKQGGALTGSIFSEVPVVLVEMAVLTNPQDDAWMASPRGQNLMATALTNATLAALPTSRQGRARAGGPVPMTRAVAD